MEDISRELEKEIIASTRYSPVKRRIKSNFFLIDDLGEIKSVGWLKPFLLLLSFISIVSIVAAFSLYHLYSGSRAEKARLAEELTAYHKKTASLNKERELLMARLVISGKLSHNFSDKKTKAGRKNVLNLESYQMKKETSGKRLSEKRSIPVLKKYNGHGKSPVYKKQIALDKNKSEIENKIVKPGKSAAVVPLKQKKTVIKQKDSFDGKINNKDTKYDKINLEGFKIVKDIGTGDLLVRFNIRNVSIGLDNISGRIFVILKPSDKLSSWLVVPGVALRDGKPAYPGRGQYFSIVHFKAVNFRVKSNYEPDSFKKAVVFIYDRGKLIFMREINIQKRPYDR